MPDATMESSSSVSPTAPSRRKAMVRKSMQRRLDGTPSFIATAGRPMTPLGDSSPAPPLPSVPPSTTTRSWVKGMWNYRRVGIQAIAPTAQATMHRPHALQRSTATAGFSRRQSTSMVMQYFTHFAQQMLSGSKIAPCGHIEIHLRQSVHLRGSIVGNVPRSVSIMTAMVCKKGADEPGRRKDTFTPLAFAVDSA
jgi:hypothetical protein